MESINAQRASTTLRAGVIGGMGPDATITFLQKFYALTRGHSEQQRPALLINIAPAIPDRNAAWRKAGESPTRAILDAGHALRQAGAQFCVIACVTAHGYVDNFEADVGIPLVRLPRLTADAIASRRLGSERPIGLLATTTTIEMGLFQKAFEQAHIPLIVPKPHEQRRLMDAIYTIKHGADAKAPVLDVIRSLTARGAHIVLLGCTDLGVLGRLEVDGCEVIDVLDLLAEKTLSVLTCGISEPVTDTPRARPAAT